MAYLQELARKKERNKKIYQYHLDHPLVSSRALGKMRHLSHTQICKIIKEEAARYGTDINRCRKES